MKALIKLLIFPLVLLPVALMAQAVQPVNCKADFYYVQDTIDPLIVNFYDQSSGNITDYSWDFGDGSTSFGQILSHAFPEVGSYVVCLKVWNNDTSDYCYDSICKVIDLVPQPAYNLGGLLYAGNFPINNPTSTGDIGYAYLYRLIDSGIIPVDTTHFDTLGYYYFVNVPAGDYMVKSGLTVNSNHFGSYLPGYYTDHAGWTSADTVHLTGNQFMAHIHMQRLQTMAAGLNSIAGYVVADGGGIGTHRVPGCEVVLNDSTGSPVKVSYTDPSGIFVFDQLSAGKYTVVAEYTSLYSEIVQVAIGEVRPANDSIAVTLHPSPVGIGETGGDLPFSVRLFPNPATDHINLALEADRFIEMEYEIIDLTGMTITRGLFSLPGGGCLKKIETSLLDPGMYLLRLRHTDSYKNLIIKIIIQ